MIDELFSLKGKTAIVTGAAGLLGKYHCKALAEAGAVVIACDIDEQNANKIFKKYSGIFVKSADITDLHSVTSLKDEIINEYGQIDILVNNAAINEKIENHNSSSGKFEDYSIELWNKSISVNLTGTFICSKIFGNEMVRQGKGTIINIASTYGIVAPDQKLYTKEDGSQDFYKSVSYPVTKAAVISLTKYLAAYWGDKGVRVNCLSPGGVENNQDEYFINKYSSKTPMGRMAHPTDYMGAIIFLASDASAYMNGANLIIDGGFTIW